MLREFKRIAYDFWHFSVIGRVKTDLTIGELLHPKRPPIQKADKPAPILAIVRTLLFGIGERSVLKITNLGSRVIWSGDFNLGNSSCRIEINNDLIGTITYTAKR